MIDYAKIQSEAQLSAQRSRGPGGQHVNKTNSAAQLKWNYKESYVIDDYHKSLVEKKLASFVTKDGEIVLRSDVHRDLESNKREVLKKLVDLLKRAFKREKPRIATKPTFGSKQRRHTEKKTRGEIKKARTAKWH
jgi:ribosome-associated protein